MRPLPSLRNSTKASGRTAVAEQLPHLVEEIERQQMMRETDADRVYRAKPSRKIETFESATV
jgi:hypothetical protein